MAYSALPSKSASDTVTLGNWDNIRDDFAAGVPDIFTTKGDSAWATGADAAARLAVGADDSIQVGDSACNVGVSWQIVPAARAFNASAIVTASATWVSLTFDSERYDTDSVHTVTGSTGRLTVPANGAGLYLIGGNIEFSGQSNPGQDWGVRVLKNGTTVLARVYGPLSGTSAFSLNVGTVDTLNATDYVELQAYAGKAGSVLASGNYSPEFWLQWVRRQ